MKYFVLFFLAISLFPLPAISQGHIVSPSDFEVILGDLWEGDFSYQDDQSDKEVKIKASLDIEKITEGEYKFNYNYPDEPKANSKSKMKIGKNHMTLNKNTIISREQLDDGMLVFETKEVGKDNKKKAIIYHRYELSTTRLAITKRVKFDGAEESITQRKHSFQR